jgi:hypothetical protein
VSEVVGSGFVRAGDDVRVNVQFAVAEDQVSITLGATKEAENAVGVEITCVLALIVVLKNDPPDVKAERLKVYIPGVTPVEVAVVPEIDRFGTAGDDERENVHPVEASVHDKLIVEPVDTALKSAGVATI